MDVHLIKVNSHYTLVMSRLTSSDYDFVAIPTNSRAGTLLYDIYSSKLVSGVNSMEDIMQSSIVSSATKVRLASPFSSETNCRSGSGTSLIQRCIEVRQSEFKCKIDALIKSRSTTCSVNALSVDKSILHLHCERNFSKLCSVIPSSVRVNGVFEHMFGFAIATTEANSSTPVHEAPGSSVKSVRIVSSTLNLVVPLHDPDLSVVPTQELRDLVMYVNSTSTGTLLPLSRAALIELARRKGSGVPIKLSW